MYEHVYISYHQIFYRVDQWDFVVVIGHVVRKYLTSLLLLLLSRFSHVRLCATQ